jgi:putative methionine-R-sulfoxide reductase with GAF domain
VSVTMSQKDLALQAAFAAALILAGALTAAAWPDTRRATLLEPRLTEELEQRLAQAEEARRILNANYEEAGAATRAARRREKDAVAGASMVTACAGNDLTQAGLKAALDALLGAFEAGGGALWTMSEAGDRLSVAVTAGKVAPVISSEPINVPEGALPASIRRVCEMRLRAASPAPQTAPDQAAAERDDDVVGSVLRDGERVIGAAAIAVRCGASFTPGDRERLVALAKPLARGLILARRRTELDRSERDTRARLDLAHTALCEASVEEVCAAAVGIATRIVACDNCTVFVLNDERDALVPVATHGEVVDLIDHVRFERGAGVSAWVAQEGKQVVIADLAREEGLRAAEVLPPRVRSFVAVPVTAASGEAVGTINVSHAQPNAFSPEDVRSLSVLASELAFTLAVRDARTK